MNGALHHVLEWQRVLEFWSRGFGGGVGGSLWWEVSGGHLVVNGDLLVGGMAWPGVSIFGGRTKRGLKSFVLGEPAVGFQSGGGAGVSRLLPGRSRRNCPNRGPVVNRGPGSDMSHGMGNGVLEE
jgi:hypothetical protein